MGTEQSYLKKNKLRKIKNLEILNQSISNLKLLQKEEEKQIHILENKKVKIQEAIKKTKIELDDIREEKKEVLETIKLFECKICMDELNKIMLVPCGHCFCLKCSTNLKECPICRTQIQSINNIYFN